MTYNTTIHTYIHTYDNTVSQIWIIEELLLLKIYKINCVGHFKSVLFTLTGFFRDLDPTQIMDPGYAPPTQALLTMQLPNKRLYNAQKVKCQLAK